VAAKGVGNELEFASVSISSPRGSSGRLSDAERRSSLRTSDYLAEAEGAAGCVAGSRVGPNASSTANSSTKPRSEEFQCSK
jgi:hypothetical protein